MKIYNIQMHDGKHQRSGKFSISDSNSVYISMSAGREQFVKTPVNKSWHLAKYGFELSDDEYIHYFTHYAAWKRFLESGEECCCIVEDNIDMDGGISEITEALDLLEQDWDVLFPYNKFKHAQDNIEMAKMSVRLLNPNSREMKEKQPFYLGFPWGSHIYFLSKKGAEQLCDSEIKQRVEDEIFYLTEHKGLQTYYDDFSWFDATKQKDFIPQARLKKIREAVLNYNTWKPEAQSLVREILAKISEIGLNHEFDLVLQGGTHLGYIRHGQIMPWDDDIDVGIEEKNLNVFLNQIQMLEDYDCGEFIEHHTKVLYYKIWHRSGNKIQGYKYTHPFIDLWVFNKVGKDIIFKNGIICPNSNLEPLIEVDFEGAKFKIPYNSIECLDHRYIDWKSKIRIYPWSHQNEKSNLRPLVAEIEVDENFRIKLE